MQAYEKHRLKLAAFDSIHGALCQEAQKRKGRDFKEWSKAAANSVWMSWPSTEHVDRDRYASY